MWTLGFDSTTSTVTVALLHNGRPVSDYSEENATSHSTTLLPAIERLLEGAGIRVKDLSLIACSAGPGSFTGVRIGVATAKGLAAPFSIPCIGVSSLEAMAHQFTAHECLVCPVINARRGNAYAALFYVDGKGLVKRLTEDSLWSLEEISVRVSEAVENEALPALPLYFTGDCVGAAVSKYAGNSIAVLTETPEDLSRASGLGAALCGLSAYKCSEDKSAFTGEALLPIYLRKAQAERELEEKAVSSK